MTFSNGTITRDNMIVAHLLRRRRKNILSNGIEKS
jgi:hypothetical protein